MTTYKQYKVYCIEEADFRTVNSFTEPTQCPNDAGHTITNLDLDPNRNFNIWNLDLSYEWQFAPGSQLIALYRNQLFNSTSKSSDSFSESLNDLFDQVFKKDDTSNAIP